MVNSSQTIENGATVYFFTTAADTKPTYRRGILDLIAYPPGHIIQFSYRRSDIHRSVLSTEREHVFKNGVVVFVDTERDKPQEGTYVPLRWVEILRIYPPASQSHEPEDRIKFFLQIGSYVEYSGGARLGQWDGVLKALDKVRQREAEGQRYFVVSGENLVGTKVPSDHVGWERLVRALSDSSRFRDAVFIRLHPLASFRTAAREVKLRPYRDGPRAYVLRPGQDYQLDFDVFIKTVRTAAPRVTLTCSGEIIKTTKPFQSVVSGLVKQYAILSCKRTIEEAESALSVEIGEPVADVVNTPNPVFLLKIDVSRRILVAFIVLVFMGSLLVSSDKDALAVFNCSPDLWVWLAKIAGSALLAWAAYLGFRKFPSGQW